MPSRYHLTAAGKLAACSATKRPCPRGGHVTAEGRANILAGRPVTTQEKLVHNVLRPAYRVYVEDPTPEVEASKPMKQLTSIQIMYFADYTGMVHHELNNGLRQGTLDTLPSRYTTMTEQMDAAFEQLKPEHEYVTYRGEVLNSKPGETAMQTITRHYFPDSVTMKPEYLSTSMNSSVAAYFARKATTPNKVAVMLEIRAKTGISMKEISGLSEEDEMLLPRNSSFKVASIRPYTKYQDVYLNEEADIDGEALEVHDTRTQILTIVLEEQ